MFLALAFRFSKAAWNPKRNLCDVLSTAPRGLMVLVWGYSKRNLYYLDILTKHISQAMAFDLIILLLCTYRLASHRTSTLGHLLLRDGIVRSRLTLCIDIIFLTLIYSSRQAYFCVVFAANLVQTVMAGLHMNPVMNIITLPFALVVSVIAATTVFRNVFTAHDNFTADSNSPSGASGPNRSDGPTLRTGARILFNHNSTTQQMSTNEIPLGDYKSTHDMEPISVHKVVDVEVDGVPTQTVCEPPSPHGMV